MKMYRLVRLIINAAISRAVLGNSFSGLMVTATSFSGVLCG